MSTAFDGERFLALVHGLSLGRPLLTTAVTDSTNDDALLAAREGAPHGALFVTDAQRRGRGRRGNTWHATPGEALLFSLVLRPNLPAERAPCLALVAGLAVRAAVSEALHEAGATCSVLVKWPNDVVVADRKLAGVLVETQMSGEKLGAVVLGVGLNVGRLELPEPIAAQATTLAALGATASREALLAGVLHALETRLETLQNPEIPLKSLLSELVAHDALRGRLVSVGELHGVANGIDAAGNLEITDRAGHVHRVRSGHVELRRA